MWSNLWSQVWSLSYAIGVSQNIVAAVIVLPVGFVWHHRILIRAWEKRTLGEPETRSTNLLQWDDDGANPVDSTEPREQD